MLFMWFQIKSIHKVLAPLRGLAEKIGNVDARLRSAKLAAIERDHDRVKTDVVIACNSAASLPTEIERGHK